MPSALTEKEFSKHLHTKFQVQIDEQEIELELIEVKGYLPQENEQGGMERFSVFFDGPPANHLPQQVYRLKHEEMGEFDLFMVPISGDEKKIRYEAVFNYYKTE